MELEIDGKTADISGSLISITRQSLDIESQSTRFVDITNQFNLPYNDINHRIFKSAYSINSNNDYFDRYYKAKLIDQFFLFNGKGYLKEISNTYKFQLVDDSKEVLDKLKGYINEIGWDDYDIIFNYANYLATNYDQETLFVWPLVAMHSEKSSVKSPLIVSNSELTYYRPFFRYSFLLNKIFELNGWTLEFDDIINRLAISANAEKFYLTSYQKTINTTITATLLGDNINTSSPSFNKVASVTSSIISDPYKTIFRLRGAVECTSLVKISIEGTSQPSGKVKISEHFINSNILYIDIQTSEFSVDGTDTSIDYEIKLYGSSDVVFSNVLLYTLIEEQNLGLISDNALIDYKVKAFDNMPKIKQIDLFRDAMIRANAIIIPDTITKTLKLQTLRYLSKLNAYDWSSKVDEGSETVSNDLSNLAQKNILSYSNDETVDINIGKSSFDTINETLENENNYFEFIFSASEDVSILGNIMAGMDIYYDTERINELTTRLVYLYDNLTNYIGRFVDISWDSIKNDYYNNWFGSLSRVRVIECYFNLNKLDVLGHDFTKLVYVDYFKSYFYVYKIDNFIPNTKTKVLMLKFL